MASAYPRSHPHVAPGFSPASFSAQQIKDVVVNSRCFGPEILQEVEVRAAAIIDGDQFSIDGGSQRQTDQRVPVKLSSGISWTWEADRPCASFV